jgi:uncharacterized membrane protein YoaK (UPF0700 family)
VPRRSIDLPLVLMLVLTFSTGVVDAVGYLGLDKVFTGNMTGNVVILGMAIAGAEDLPVLGPALALGGFMLGAAVGGRVLRRAPVGWSGRTTILFALVGLVCAGLGATMLVAGDDLPQPLVLGVTTTLGAAMGLQAATARRLAVKDVTTVVVTSTITGLAADSWLAGGDGAHWARRSVAVVAIGAGAVVGALCLRIDRGVGLLLTALLCLVVALVGHWKVPRPDPVAQA